MGLVLKEQWCNMIICHLMYFIDLDYADINPIYIANKPIFFTILTNG